MSRPAPGWGRGRPRFPPSVTPSLRVSGSGGRAAGFFPAQKSNARRVQTPQAINQGDRALPEGNCPQRIHGRFPQPLRTLSPRGRGAKDPPPVPKVPRGSERGSPPPGSLPLLCLSPRLSAAFTVVAIKCQLLGVRNNKHCNSAQSKHPLSV